MNQVLPAVLTLNKISKNFAGVQALNDVSFELMAGEVHALLGENGAGKSTLIKVMTGAYSLDAGSIELNGKTIQPNSPAQALSAGISTVYQEVNLLPNLSVAHNLFLGREPKRFCSIDWKKVNADAEILLQRFRLQINVKQPLASYSLAIQQLVAIARGIDMSARVLVLDEPTASLDRKEVKLLFSILEELKSQGIAIIFITHFLDQVYSIADRISVLRNGKRVGTFVTTDLPRAELVAHMLGREIDVVEATTQNKKSVKKELPAFEVENLSAENGINNISFSVEKGEVLGLSGLLGSGRTELCEALFGLAFIRLGSLRIEGKALQITSPRKAIYHGLAMCPENRKADGIIGNLSIRENIILALQAKQGWLKLIPQDEQKNIANAAVRNINIACPDIEKEVGLLSGGNQQKVILARWLASNPKILILDEPTRGIDIGAHAEIIKLIRQLCDRGMTVIVASSEVEELVVMCDKIMVMREHSMQAELVGSDISEQGIMAAIAQVH